MTTEPPNAALPDHRSPGPVRRARGALLVAIVADALQLAALPFFASGTLSPLNDVLDVVVAIVLIWLVGWHWAFLPTFVAEVVPGLDLVPTWTAAVWLVSRRRKPRSAGSPPTGT